MAIIPSFNKSNRLQLETLIFCCKITFNRSVWLFVQMTVRKFHIASVFTYWILPLVNCSTSHHCHNHQGPVTQQINCYPAYTGRSVNKTYCAIHPRATFPVDGVIHPSNNRCQYCEHHHHLYSHQKHYCHFHHHHH